MFIKWQPFKVFEKLHKSPLLIANIVKGAVLGLRQFLPIEIPRKLKKNILLNILFNMLTALFVLEIFKFCLDFLFMLEREG